MAVVIFTLVVGAVFLLLFYICKFVISDTKEKKPDKQERKKSLESSKKQHQQSQVQQSVKGGGGKKKNAEKRIVRDSKQAYSHPWLLTNLKGHSSTILDMDFSPNGKYLATSGEAEPHPPDPGGGQKTLLTRRQKKNRFSKKHQERKTASPAALSAAELEAYFRHYVLTPEQMVALGYPMESEEMPGCAVICHPFPPHEVIPVETRSCSESGSSGSEEGEDDVAITDPSVQSEERKCVRCGRGFFLLQDTYLTTESCTYHWGRPQRGLGYSCCRGDDRTPGCTSARLHVWSGTELGVNGPLSGYTATRPRRSPPPNGTYGVYAIDCEMCFTTQGLELCKVSVVALDGHIEYDTYVKPDHPVVDYNTRFSGITAKHFQKNGPLKTLKEVQHDLMKLISSNTILIGHGLENDLKALRILHTTVVDTAVAFPHHFGLPYRRSLRSLMSTVLQREIQVSKHDSVEDARACIQLMFFRLACDFKHLPLNFTAV